MIRKKGRAAAVIVAALVAVAMMVPCIASAATVQKVNLGTLTTENYNTWKNTSKTIEKSTQGQTKLAAGKTLSKTVKAKKNGKSYKFFVGYPQSLAESSTKYVGTKVKGLWKNERTLKNRYRTSVPVSYTVPGISGFKATAKATAGTTKPYKTTNTKTVATGVYKQGTITKKEYFTDSLGIAVKTNTKTKLVIKYTYRNNYKQTKTTFTSTKPADLSKAKVTKNVNVSGSSTMHYVTVTYVKK